jgi:hypothetical protein
LRPLSVPIDSDRTEPNAGVAESASSGVADVNRWAVPAFANTHGVPPATRAGITNATNTNKAMNADHAMIWLGFISLSPPCR